MNCPNDHGRMELKTMDREIFFRGRYVKFGPRHFVCPVCALEVDDIPLAAENQKALSDAYRKDAELLTGKEIVERRKRLGWTQERLAQEINVGVASVKRWEKGQIQTKPMNDALRRALEGKGAVCDPYSGNRTLSLPRIKLILGRFSKYLRRKMLSNTSADRLLYAAKYLWYADMIAFRDTGRSMTGATYATLPHGPQLNNYRELVKLVRESNESEAEPITEHEDRILARIAMAFPDDSFIYRAVHDEPIYKAKKVGELIPYSEAERIQALK